MVNGGVQPGVHPLGVFAIAVFVFLGGIGSGLGIAAFFNPAPKPPLSTPVPVEGRLLTRNAPSNVTVFVNITIEVNSEVEATAHYEVKKCNDSEEYEMDLSTNYTITSTINIVIFVDVNRTNHSYARGSSFLAFVFVISYNPIARIWVIVVT